VPKASSYLPSGFQTLTVHLTVNGADGRLLNASVRIADSVMMLNDVFPEFGGEASQSRRAVRLTLYLPDADAV
jgi:hypothetical protein